ncbi:3-phenylpropionate dioxygenase alpha subunit [Klebsiella pneumoniae]|uniref:3-phenylpropionate dioxygenase alpha subunit n=1 Tax=Klebsiella pneumoniae TaxID=573 RepID=A0A378F563_KLEPN|nr:3-phenylpropionate dioxygenase alpha subunit [Klebsiella pneumoniae]
MQKTLSTLKDKINNALVVDREIIFTAAIALYLPTRSCLNLK